VAVLNETMAGIFFPKGDAVGQQLLYPNMRDAVTIVGVVRDAKYRSLREQPLAVAYFPYLQARTGRGQMTLVVRTTGLPETAAAALRREIQAIAPEMPSATFTTLAGLVDVSILEERWIATLSSLFGALALVLAAVGLYGVMSYTAARRTREIGIRMALGAEGAAIRRALIGEALRVGAIGLAAGLPLALVAGRLVESFLYGLAPADPVTLAGAGALMLAIAALAAWLPARRASRVDPMEALRHE
jgi:ABC-type antimicrobial peptide transport system permease subunit